VGASGSGDLVAPENGTLLAENAVTSGARKCRSNPATIPYYGN
jgi:hypothetical protein